MKTTWISRVLFLTLALLLGSVLEGMAQCPMCRSAVETGLMEEGNTIGIGLNDGILYLLAAPYLVVFVVGTLWYRRFRKSSSAGIY